MRNLALLVLILCASSFLTTTLLAHVVVNESEDVFIPRLRDASATTPSSFVGQGDALGPMYNMSGLPAPTDPTSTVTSTTAQNTVCSATGTPAQACSAHSKNATPGMQCSANSASTAGAFCSSKSKVTGAEANECSTYSKDNVHPAQCSVDMSQSSGDPVKCSAQTGSGSGNGTTALCSVDNSNNIKARCSATASDPGNKNTGAKCSAFEQPDGQTEGPYRRAAHPHLLWANRWGDACHPRGGASERCGVHAREGP